MYARKWRQANEQAVNERERERAREVWVCALIDSLIKIAKDNAQIKLLQHQAEKLKFQKFSNIFSALNSSGKPMETNGNPLPRLSRIG